MNEHIIKPMEERSTVEKLEVLYWTATELLNAVVLAKTAWQTRNAEEYDLAMRMCGDFIMDADAIMDYAEVAPVVPRPDLRVVKG